MRREERGISSVVAMVSLVGLFGAAALSLDAGNMWQTRRNIVTATDATALQQARYFSFATPGAVGTTQDCPTSVADAWTDYLFRNGGSGTTPISCQATWGNNGVGYVVVQGKKQAKTRFGGLLGLGDTNPYSLSASVWGFPTSVIGLRPMGICTTNDHFRQWTAYVAALKSGDTATIQKYEGLKNQGDVGGPDPAGGPWYVPPPDGTMDYPAYAAASNVVHRIYFTKENPDECGNEVPGNWGFMDYDGGGQQNQQDLATWIRFGYGTNRVGVNDCDGDAGLPGGESNDRCEGDPGSSGGSIAQALQALVDNETRFSIPIYDSATLQGSSAQYNMYAFVGVILRGFDVQGQEASRYFDLEFTRLQTTGNCCDDTPPNVDTGIRALKLCDVDHDTQAGQTVATRCATS